MDVLLLRAYLRSSFRRQAQSPAMVVCLAVGNLSSTVLDVLAILVLFSHFGGIADWSVSEVMMLYAVTGTSFSIGEFITRGFDVFGVELLRRGHFDRLLVRPRPLIIQIIGYDFRISRCGRLIQSLAALAFAATSLRLQLDVLTCLFLLWTVVGGIALFVSIIILQAVVSFWTEDPFEGVSALTYGSVYAAQYPIDLYPLSFRIILTCVIPLACVTYYPVLLVLGKAADTNLPAWLLAAAPGAGLAFFGLTLLAWRAGVTRYTSTGS